MPQTWNLMPDVLGQYNAGVDRGRSLQASKLAGLAYGADNPDDQQSDLASLASLNPGMAMQLGDNLQQRASDKLAQIGAAANYLVNAHQTGNQAAVQGAYQAIKPTLQKFINEHGDSSTVPDQWDDSMLPNLYQVVAASQHAVNGRIPAALQTFNAMTQGLSPDQVNEARRIKAGLDPRATSPNYSPVTIHNQDGTAIQAFLNKRTGQVESPDYSSLPDPNGSQGQPAQSGLPAETQNYVPKVLSQLGGQPPLNGDGTASPALLQAIIKTESNGNPNAQSSKGAQGLMQLMPATAASVGVSDPSDPVQNVRGGQAYLNQLLQKYKGDIPTALAAYNAGPGAVDAALSGGQQPQATGHQWGVIPAKQDKPGELQQKLALASKMGATPEQLKQMVMGQAASEGAPDIPGNTQATGDEYLQSLPAQQAAQVKALAEGRMAFPTGTALKSPYWQGMLGAVSQYDPQFDAVNYNARSKTRNDFTSGKSAQTINALNTVAEHLGTLSDYADSLGNTSFPMVNSVKNAFLSATGDPRIAQFNTAKKAAADEVAKVWRASGGSEADIQENLKNLDGAQSPAQLHAAIGTLVQLIGGKLGALQDQYKSGMGTAAQQGVSFVSPQAANAYSKVLQKAGMSADDIAPQQPDQQTQGADFSHLWGGN